MLQEGSGPQHSRSEGVGVRSASFSGMDASFTVETEAVQLSHSPRLWRSREKSR
jgi:hypothetical protein